MRKQSGGSLDGNPPSAWGWMLGTVGNGLTQFQNVFIPKAGTNLSIDQSNDIVPVTSGKQTGGKRRKSSKKRGGNIVSQAAVPLVLVGLNQMAKTRKHGRHRRHKRKY